MDRVGKLTDYPTYELPVKNISAGLMPDIGTGWGRWLVAGAAKGYIPVGIDLRLEFCQAAHAYSAAADSATDSSGQAGKPADFKKG